MPTLQFKGKNIIWNHHLSVPYHALEEVSELHFQPAKSNNLIVEGDNLVALKALLPKYAGKIDGIYIDPPYNTGKQSGQWIYSDKVNSVLIRDWFGKVVGEQDLTKHDKWLCMMAPRLKLLRDLLSQDGVIFISIDEHEEHHLRNLMDEIFGADCFIEKLVWNKRIPKNDKGIGNIHEYILLYSKSSEVRHEFYTLKGGIEEVYAFVESLKKKKTPIDEAEKKLKQFYNKKGFDRGITLYSNLDADYKLWGKINVSWPNDDKGPRYDVLHPKTKKAAKVPDNGWRYIKDTFDSYLDYDNVIERHDGSFVCGKVWFAKDENTQPSYIQHLDNVKDFLLRSIISQKSSGGSELKELVPDADFPHPKTYKLLNILLSTLKKPKQIILDSFAGSGTTAHSVMELNLTDDIEREFIMVQMKEDSPEEPTKNICRDVTRERIKNAITKYGYDSGFKYLRVGTPIDPETMLQGELPTYQQFAEYVYYLATGGHLAEKAKVDSENHFVGVEGSQAVYLIYEQDIDKLSRLALTLQLAEQIVKHSPGKRRVIFAPSCFLDEEYMTAMQIEFVSVPYNLFERKTQG